MILNLVGIKYPINNFALISIKLVISVLRHLNIHGNLVPRNKDRCLWKEHFYKRCESFGVMWSKMRWPFHWLFPLTSSCGCCSQSESTRCSQHVCWSRKGGIGTWTRSLAAVQLVVWQHIHMSSVKHSDFFPCFCTVISDFGTLLGVQKRFVLQRKIW